MSLMITPYETEKFHHERLKLGGNSMRLITLQPNKDEYSWINCEIHQYALHRRPGYIALSYTWGSPDEQYPIFLNGKSFDIRRNLYDCLVQLRRQHDEPITLWIDALCIDQDNIPERNHVVQLMDQVYERSDMVYVWLGPGDESSDRAMDFILEIAQQMELQKDSVDVFFETYVVPAIYYQDWVAVVRLFKRGYWTRLWIIQETLLAPSLELFCGDRRMLWKHIERIVTLLKHLFNHLSRQYSRKLTLFAGLLNNTLAARIILRRCEEDRFSGRRETFPSLQTLLENFKDCDCFDARDEIFGLMSIAGDFHDRRVDYIDYQLRPTQVFINFLKHYLASFTTCGHDETLYNIRRLSDALRLNINNILQRRQRDKEVALFYSDITTYDDSSKLTMPCEPILSFLGEAERPNTTSSAGVLRAFYTRDTDRAPSDSRSTPNMTEELSKVQSLARSRGLQICNAWSNQSSECNASMHKPDNPDFQYFSQIASLSSPARSCFGLACSGAQPGDILIKSKESDLYFIARRSHGETYDVIGTAMIHESSKMSPRSRSSIFRFWQHRREKSTSSDVEGDLIGNTESEVQARFNPLMLLMIVNDPNWRKRIFTEPTTTKLLARQPSYYQAIQPRGEDDPLHKSFGERRYAGSAHIDRAANKVRDRASLKIEEIRDLAHALKEGTS